MNYLSFSLLRPVDIYQKVLQFPIDISAILLIMLVGLLICIAGYRLIYLTMGLCGFIILFSSSLLFLSALIPHLFPLILILSISLGIGGGVSAIFFYRSGIFLLGVLGGFSFGIVIIPVLNSPIIMILLGVAGGVLSLIVEKIALIISTASIGSLVFVWSLVRILEFIEVLSISPDFEPSYIRMVCMLTWFGFTLLGCAIQYKYIKKRRK